MGTQPDAEVGRISPFLPTASAAQGRPEAAGRPHLRLPAGPTGKTKQNANITPKPQNPLVSQIIEYIGIIIYKNGKA
jgi:hypothetical protein